MQNEDVYYQLFDGLKFKKEPQVPPGQEFQKLMALLTTKEWLESNQQILRTSIENKDFLCLFQTLSFGVIPSQVKFETYSNSVVIKVGDSRLEMVFEATKVTAETKKKAAAVKLLEIFKSPWFEAFKQQVELSKPSNNFEAIQVDETESLDKTFFEQPPTKPSKFYEEYESSDENEKKTSKPQVQYTLQKQARSEDNESESPHREVSKWAGILDEPSKPKEETPKIIGLSQVSSPIPIINKLEAIPKPDNTDLNSTQLSRLPKQQILKGESNVITNQNFRKVMEDSDLSDVSPSPRSKSPVAKKEIDIDKVYEPETNWLPLPSFSVTSLFEEIFIDQYVRRGEIDKESDLHPFPIQVGVRTPGLIADWFSESMVVEVTQALKEEGITLFYSMQEDSVKKTKDFRDVLFLAKTIEGRLEIAERVSVAKSLNQPIVEKLSMFRFLSSYFPLVAAKLAHNTMKKSLKGNIRKVQFDLPLPCKDERLKEADKPKSSLRMRPVITTKPKGELSFAKDSTVTEISVEDPRVRYIAENKQLMLSKYANQSNAERLSGDKLDEYFGYELIHNPAATVKSCRLYKAYQQYKKKAQKLLADPERLQSLQKQLNMISNLQQALDLIMKQLFNEIVMAVHVKDKPHVAIFMSSKDPTQILTLEFADLFEATRLDLQVLGSMVAVRLFAKQLYKPLLKQWVDQSIRMSN